MESKMKFLALALLCVVGCAGQQITGNGDLVIIDVDDAFAEHWIDGPDGDVKSLGEIDAVHAGVHYWNAFGANLKVADELTPEEAMGDHQHFGIHRNANSFPTDDHPPIGTDWVGLDFVTIYTTVLRHDGEMTFYDLREDVAHELGHAIGLNHLRDNQIGTMTAFLYWKGEYPSKDDQDQFCTLYPGCKKVWPMR